MTYTAQAPGTRGRDRAMHGFHAGRLVHRRASSPAPTTSFNRAKSRTVTRMPAVTRPLWRRDRPDPLLRLRSRPRPPRSAPASRWRDLFDALDRVAADRERHMRRGGGDDDACLADVQAPHPMMHGQRRSRPPFRGFRRDPLERPDGSGAYASYSRRSTRRPRSRAGRRL